MSNIVTYYNYSKHISMVFTYKIKIKYHNNVLTMYCLFY